MSCVHSTPWLLESKTTNPHEFISADVSLAGVAALRAELKAAGVRASVNDCVVYAASRRGTSIPTTTTMYATLAALTRRLVCFFKPLSTNEKRVFPLTSTLKLSENVSREWTALCTGAGCQTLATWWFRAADRWHTTRAPPTSRPFVPASSTAWRGSCYARGRGHRAGNSCAVPSLVDNVNLGKKIFEPKMK